MCEPHNQGTTRGAHTLEREPPEDLFSLLAKVEILGGLFAEWALWLARRAPEMRLVRGHILYGPGRASRTRFALLEGRVCPGRRP